jgi:hypothetical protein
MLRLSSVLLLSALAPSLMAQVCPNPTLGTVVGNGDDTMLTQQAIGFAFPFAGATYTDVHICTNGYFHLSNGGTPAPGGADGTATSAELASGSPRICALWSDHNLTVANGANVYINSTPAKCTITWDRCVNYGGTTLFTFQAQLFPSGEIAFVYDANCTNNSTFSAAYAAGLVGVSPGGGATLPAASDLLAGGASPDNTLFEDFLAAMTFDMQSRSLQLIPTSPGWAFVCSPLSTCASATDYGTGCYANPDTFYEFFATAAAMDLSGRTITMLRQGTGYVVLDSIPGTYVPPSASAQVIVAGDDVVSAALPLSQPMPVAGGATNSIVVSSNGVVSLAGTGIGNAYTPTTAAFLGWGETSVCCWHDYNNTITGSGSVKFEQVGTIAYVTWDGVISHTTTVPDTLQFQLDVVTGNVTIVLQTLSGVGNAYLVGYSRGGASPDPGSADLSTVLANPLNVADSPFGLTLAGNGRPFLGNASFALNVSQVEPVAPLAFVFFGSTQAPGIDLGFIGAPNCRAYSSADLGSLTLPVIGGSGSLPFGIPNNPAFTGVTLTAQAVAFTTQNQLGLATSNGTELLLGN